MPFADPDDARTYNREYKRRNRHRFQRRQKVVDATRHANERAARLGVEGVLAVDDVEVVLDTEVCAWCSKSTAFPDRSLDHRIPMAKGGPNTIENVVMACRSCNADKHMKAATTSWSVHHDSCLRCGTTDRAHSARGLCSPCYFAIFTDPDRGRRQLVGDDLELRRQIESAAA